MLDDVAQQSASAIYNEIARLRGLLEVDLRTKQAHVEAVQTKFDEIQAAFEEIKLVRANALAAAEAAEMQYNAAFTVPAGPTAPLVVPALASSEVSQVVVQSGTVMNGKPAAVAAPSARPSAKAGNGTQKRPRTGLTVPERVAAAMGDGAWDAGSLAQVLANTPGEDFKSNNLRNYLSGIFSGSRMRVPGPNGEDLVGPDGKPLEVSRFTKLERGKYRVATPEDVQAEVQEAQREARRAAGSSEVIISENSTPADELFAEHGIDVRPAMGAA